MERRGRGHRRTGPFRRVRRRATRQRRRVTRALERRLARIAAGRALTRRWSLWRWDRRGRPVPPPHAVKERIVLDHARERGISVLVETGTLYGEMIEATLHSFRRIWSIELSPELGGRAAARFRRWPHVTIVQGDSGVELARVAAQVDEPAVFWLDGHYSGGSPRRVTSRHPSSPSSRPRSRGTMTATSCSSTTRGCSAR